MSRKKFVLGQHVIDGCPEPGQSDFLGAITKDVINSEVGADPVADIPASDFVANCEDLASHVGTRNDIILLTEGVPPFGDDEISELMWG
ncbi:hypothetical protein AcV5_005333 [Taiwanofungus camphoratus]|nr:hypothetical protein AcW2_000064 [Antrodia cinnamomea]KAI0937417.1 hypothetical protein AcV5_005333 [Antrodia cinnamomea]